MEVDDSIPLTTIGITTVLDSRLLPFYPPKAQHIRLLRNVSSQYLQFRT